MKFLTPKQEEVFNNLVRLADGDAALVENALREYGSNKNTATLSQVIQFIQEKTENTMRKVKFEELKVGMLTNSGLIVRFESGGKLFNSERSINIFDLNDSYFGKCSRSVRKDEVFEILYEQGTDEYKKEIQRLITERISYIIDAEADVDLLRAYKAVERDQ